MGESFLSAEEVVQSCYFASELSFWQAVSVSRFMPLLLVVIVPTLD